MTSQEGWRGKQAHPHARIRTYAGTCVHIHGSICRLVHMHVYTYIDMGVFVRLEHTQHRPMISLHQVHQMNHSQRPSP